MEERGPQPLISTNMPGAMSPITNSASPAARSSISLIGASRRISCGVSFGNICSRRVSIVDISGLAVRRCDPLVSHQKRNRRLGPEILGHAAEQPLAQAQVTVSAHNDKVGLSSLSLCDQLGSDFTFAALDAMKPGVDSVMLEMIDSIDTGDPPLFGRALASHDDDRNLIRPM